MLTVNEIFKSIQGESTYAGLPCAFVRLTGCNQRCVYCDTTYAYAAGRPMTLQQVRAAVDRLGVKLVEVTGGEPLLQQAVYALMRDLLAGGYTVLLETSGTVSIAEVPRDVVKIMDLKCPGSGAAEANVFDNINHLTPRDEVKFVIRDRTDYEWSVATLRRHGIAEKCHILFSPVHGKLDLKDLARWILQDQLPVRLQTQLHKIIWDKDAIGV